MRRARSYGPKVRTRADRERTARLFVAECHPAMLPTYTPERVAEINGVSVEFARGLLSEVLL